MISNNVAYDSICLTRITHIFQISDKNVSIQVKINNLKQLVPIKIKIIKTVFDSNKGMKAYFEFIESDNKPEYMSIESKRLEPQDNLTNQLNDFKLPSDEMENIHDMQMFDNNNTSKENLEEEGLLKTPTFKLTGLLNDSHFNFMDAKYFDFGNELFEGRNNQVIQLLEEQYYEKPRFDKTVHFEPSKDVQAFQSNSKTLFQDKSKLFVHPNQYEHDIIEDKTIKVKQESSVLTRWGRDDDILAFKALREL